MWSCQSRCCYENSKYNIYMRICERKLCNGVPLRECQFSLFQFQFELSNSIFIGVKIKKRHTQLLLIKSVSIKSTKANQSREEKKRGAYTKNYYLLKKKLFLSLTEIQNWFIYFWVDSVWIVYIFVVNLCSVSFRSSHQLFSFLLFDKYHFGFPKQQVYFPIAILIE